MYRVIIEMDSEKSANYLNEQKGDYKMNITTLHNSSASLEPQYKRTNLRTITGKAIYLKTSYDGIQTYVTKGRTLVFEQSQANKHYKAKSVPCWNSLDPLEHEQLYTEYPERFSGYRMALLRESMLSQKGANFNVHV